jgi:secreted trypsin-like serine protease
LTAAHCVDGANPHSHQVWLGAHNVRTSTEPGREEIFGVGYVHKDWDSQTLSNDIAIITLDRAAPLSTYTHLDLVVATTKVGVFLV